MWTLALLLKSVLPGWEKQNPSPKQPEEKCSFSSAYWSWVKKLLVVHGVCGPCDVYDPNLSGLLVRWCGCKGSQVNWLLVEKKWNVECGPAAVHSCLQFLKGGVARAMATRAINRELQARNLPKTFGFTCKIPRQSCLQVVRRALVQVPWSKLLTVTLSGTVVRRNGCCRTCGLCQAQ